MQYDDPDLEIAAAREAVLAWLLPRQPGTYETNAELADAFAAFLAKETALKLLTQRNPSAMVHEARWYAGGRQLPEFPRPFCAENEADARILACAGLIALDGE